MLLVIWRTLVQKVITLTKVSEGVNYLCYVSCGEGVPKLTLWTFAKFQVYWIVLVIGMPILSVIPSNTLILKYFILRSQEQAIRA